jgi:hypothetical protein
LKQVLTIALALVLATPALATGGGSPQGGSATAVAVATGGAGGNSTVVNNNNPTTNNQVDASSYSASAPGFAGGQCNIALSVGLTRHLVAAGISVPLRACNIVAEADSMWRMGMQDAARQHLAHIPRVSRTYRMVNQARAEAEANLPYTHCECIDRRNRWLVVIPKPGVDPAVAKAACRATMR